MLLVAHRAPATAAGCRLLADAGAQVFEVDVQLAAGGIRVSHYVPVPAFGWLQRDNWRVRPRSAAVRDATLAAAMAAVPEHCAVLLDLKETLPVRRQQLIEAIARSLPADARVLASSPVPSDLDRLRQVGLSTWRTVRGRGELAAVLVGAELADEAVTVRHTLLTAAVVSQLQARVAQVIAWTVNDVDQANRLRDIGVDGITTDRVDVLQALAG